MAETNFPPAQMGQLEITYRDVLVELKKYVTQLESQTDAMLCIKWIQKLQTLTEPNDIKLRNYLLHQICNQIRFGYLDHPFINLSYLDQDLNVVSNCCREFEAMSRVMCNTTEDVLEIGLERSLSNITTLSILNASDFDSTMKNEHFKSLAKPNILKNENGIWEEPNTPLISVFENVLKSQNFYQRKYEETLEELKEIKLKLYVNSTHSMEQFVESLGNHLIDKYQNAVVELLAIEKSPNLRQEFLSFELNIASKFKSSCGDLLNAKTAENLVKAERQLQTIFYRLLSDFIDSNECRNDLVSTGRATISTDLELVNNTKYCAYLNRYIRKQQKQFNRKIQDYESQIVALKTEIRIRDKKQSMQIIELKCENIIKNDQKTRDQLSESVAELESKYKHIVQQLIDEMKEQS